MTECIFCRIGKGVAPASIVYSDAQVLAFMDILPVNPGHVLIVPKVHAAQLSGLSEETGAQMFRVAMRISKGLRLSNIKCEGVMLLLADGEVAGQEVLHVHLHVIPRYAGDGFGMKFGPRYGSKPDRKELDKVASEIVVALTSG